MRKNMGRTDRMLRAALIAPALVLGGILLGPGGWLAVVAYGLAGVMVATALVGFCPLYALFGLSTRPVAERRESALSR